MSENQLVNYRIVNKIDLIHDCKFYKELLVLFDSNFNKYVDHEEYLVIKEQVFESNLIKELVQ